MAAKQLAARALGRDVGGIGHEASGSGLGDRVWCHYSELMLENGGWPVSRQAI